MKPEIYRRAGADCWYCRFQDSAGKWIRLSTKQMDESEARKASIAIYQDWQESQSPELIRVERILDIYFDAVGNHRDKSYQHNRKNIMQWFGSSAKWADLAPGKKYNIYKFIQHRQNHDGVAPATVNKDVGVLRAAANYVIEKEGIPLINHAAGKQLKVPRYQHIWISQEQAVALIAAAEKYAKAPHLPVFIVISLGTGLRAGETLRIRISDISLHTQTIQIPNTKSDQPHVIPMNEDVLMAIKYRLQWIREQGVMTDWLFCHATGKRRGERIKSVKRSFRQACIDAGIPVTSRKLKIKGFRIHDQRHTCASWLVSSGVPLIMVKDLLNHSSIDTTEKFYAHLHPESRLKTVNSIPHLKTLKKK